MAKKATADRRQLSPAYGLRKLLHAQKYICSRHSLSLDESEREGIIAANQTLKQKRWEIRREMNNQPIALALREPGEDG